MLLIFDKINNTEKKDIFLLLDEPDLTLHPQWQKNYIKELIKLLSTFPTKQFHVIITSHSPFILSDLPKENIIFLEKGKQVYPFEDGKQTFGANIHTLLSHGFFMKDGLMGEFAKEKIDKAIEYLNKKTLTNEELDYCENIISIIGEPIIKRELQRKLDSKRLSKIDKIDEIEKQMKIIEEQRKLLENRLELIRKNQI
jgi:ABC-type multidrug transport system ATPase subunit